MTNKYLILLVLTVSAIVVGYSAYSYYLIGDNPESLNATNYGDNISTSINETGKTNNYTDTDGLNETLNRTNQSTISIPLEKPPFID